jgi:HJR/Mrr/RecB family endonuclease
MWIHAMRVRRRFDVLGEPLRRHTGKVRPLRARLGRLLRLPDRRPVQRDTISLAELDRLDGGAFEQALAEFFTRRGYTVTRTPLSGDYGVDLVIKRRWRPHVAVQCKRYAPGSAVGLVAVQEVFAGKTFYACPRAMVVTTADYSAPARRLAQRLDVELWDRDRLAAEFSRRSASKPAEWRTRQGA